MDASTPSTAAIAQGGSSAPNYQELPSYITPNLVNTSFWNNDPAKEQRKSRSDYQKAYNENAMNWYFEQRSADAQYKRNLDWYNMELEHNSPAYKVEALRRAGLSPELAWLQQGGGMGTSVSAPEGKPGTAKHERNTPEPENGLGSIMEIISLAIQVASAVNGAQSAAMAAKVGESTILKNTAEAGYHNVAANAISQKLPGELANQTAQSELLEFEKRLKSIEALIAEDTSKEVINKLHWESARAFEDWQKAISEADMARKQNEYFDEQTKLALEEGNQRIKSMIADRNIKEKEFNLHRNLTEAEIDDMMDKLELEFNKFGFEEWISRRKLGNSIHELGEYSKRIMEMINGREPMSKYYTAPRAYEAWKKRQETRNKSRENRN